MTIQWYPGHMAKAKREMIEKIKQIDVVIELVDARIPESSRNPLVDEIAGQKPRLVILNKSDLADPKQTERWQAYFQKQGFSTIAVNSQTGSGTDKIAMSVSQLTAERRQRLENKGVNPRADRALILGIPNVGKSTLINRLANKRIAKIGDRPGITKTQQWIKIGSTLQLLDTPGILWPKFEDQTVGLRLAATGAIKDEVIDYEEIATYILRFMVQHYPEALINRYGLSENLDTLDIVELYDAIGKKRGCLMSGGYIDYDKTAEIIVREFRSQKLGRVTLEAPNPVPEAQ
ncbi:ribosome biogenesis GTPase A [Pullulanibacillus pueri]|uniref:Ribosome biogenesis GTPase A n=1 Tax=Pullulanibacillus pueri TaxID=1437324 RepID=A0A8J2ZS13_9BACL|nr:ribosome biogenesis GTPase YlqF [Pullulanibacillus pueri]MBM7680213.1 ribosome biogenesis GTPase A [Pullulanibacillus pueri]GGH74920.1 ribosome biogenesis GTPase A [Pullulanibacillus pueri]